MKSEDPNLTAYALGELDAESLSATAREIAGQPELAAEAWEIRGLGARLRRELAQEQPMTLRADQRARVFAEADRAAAIIHAERHWWRGWVPAAAAACAALAIGGSFFVESQQFSQWFFWSTSKGVNINLVENPAPESADGLPPVDPSMQANPTYHVASATPGAMPANEGLTLPPAPNNAARLAQIPDLQAEPQVAGPKVDPSTIPMKGRLHMAGREREKVKSRLGVKAPVASPTPAVPATPAAKAPEVK